MRPVPSRHDVSTPPTGCAPLVLRLAWFAAGPFALVVFALRIAQRGDFSGLDAAYWLVVAAVLALRWLDISRFGGLTREGEAATLRDWQRHALLLTLVAGAGWALAHAGHRWLGG